MTKISPIINRITPSISKIKHPVLTKNLTYLPESATFGTIGTCGIIFSSFLNQYNKTANEENFFQFKINPLSGEHYKPDIFQNAAGMNLYLGNDVLVTAPTGTGKTAIAEYIITKNFKEGKKTFYTTPLKALSNEKYLDFSKIYGSENVGLLTGDIKTNTEAPIIVMTTEVYRNMVAAGKFNYSDTYQKGVPHDLKTVIFDELQYLGDVDRGGIWEQSLMFTPKNVQILSLSATIQNNEEINNWIASIKNQKSVAVTPKSGYLPNRTLVKETVLINVPSQNRHVPLNFEIEPVAAEIKVPRGVSKKQKMKAKQDGARNAQSIYAKPKDEAFKKLTKKLADEDKLPAIYFVFSKKECRHLLKYLSTESEILTNEQEQKEIERIFEKYKSEGVYLGESLNIEALKKGYAIHNAGLIPSQKSLIEELFQKKLIKVVLATETLSAGINMPARTTVISSPRKPASTSDGGNDNKRNLTANEFHQMAGRAGRRGIDSVGFCYSLSCNPEQKEFYTSLINSPSNSLNSNLELDFSFITKYLAEFNDTSELRYILSKSLFAYNPDGSVNNENLNKIMDSYSVKKGILKQNNYINNLGKLTLKGHLIRHLNGYEQIPIINCVANRMLADLSPKQIVGIMGGLANIEYITRGELPSKEYEMKTDFDSEFIRGVHDVVEEVKDYDRGVISIYPQRELKVNTKIMDHLYFWAQLNDLNDNKRENWKELYSGELKTSIKDEGSLFKEIMMTKDLLKQLTEVASAGMHYAETAEEADYYRTLSDKLKECIRLVEPDKGFNPN